MNIVRGPTAMLMVFKFYEVLSSMSVQCDHIQSLVWSRCDAVDLFMWLIVVTLMAKWKEVTMNISVLSSEILELIFQNLDGVTFLRIRRVCCFWNQTAWGMERASIFNWKSVCFSEILPDVLIDLCGKVSTTTILLKPDINWKSIFRKWCCAKNVGSWSFIRRRLATESPLTCVAAFG